MDKKLNDDSISSLVVDEALNLSEDLGEEEEQQGSADHEDLTLHRKKRTKVTRVVRKKKLEAPIRFSTRLKNKKNQG
jgi:hypothetical protein